MRRRLRVCIEDSDDPLHQPPRRGGVQLAASASLDQRCSYALQAAVLNLGSYDADEVQEDITTTINSAPVMLRAS